MPLAARQTAPTLFFIALIAIAAAASDESTCDNQEELSRIGTLGPVETGFAIFCILVVVGLLWLGILSGCKWEPKHYAPEKPEEEQLNERPPPYAGLRPLSYSHQDRATYRSSSGAPLNTTAVLHFRVQLPENAFAGQHMKVQVPRGYLQAGQSVAFIVPEGVSNSMGGKFVDVPLPGTGSAPSATTSNPGVLRQLSVADAALVKQQVRLQAQMVFGAPETTESRPQIVSQSDWGKLSMEQQANHISMRWSKMPSEERMNYLQQMSPKQRKELAEFLETFIKVGDRVTLVGLVEQPHENGKMGVVAGVEGHLAQVAIEGSGLVAVHLTNLFRPAGAIPFEIGDRVTVAGLLEHPHHNGKTGIVTRVVGALVQVAIEGEGVVAIDASNLNRSITAFKIGDNVTVIGLQVMSQHNGKRGMVTGFQTASGDLKDTLEKGGNCLVQFEHEDTVMAFQPANLLRDAIGVPQEVNHAPDIINGAAFGNRITVTGVDSTSHTSGCCTGLLAWMSKPVKWEWAREPREMVEEKVQNWEVFNALFWLIVNFGRRGGFIYFAVSSIRAKLADGKIPIQLPFVAVYGFDLFLLYWFWVRQEYCPGCLYNEIHVFLTGCRFEQVFSSKDGTFSGKKKLFLFLSSFATILQVGTSISQRDFFLYR